MSNSNISGKEITKKFYSLRIVYRANTKRIRESSLLMGVLWKTSYKYFNNLKFLDEVEEVGGDGEGETSEGDSVLSML